MQQITARLKNVPIRASQAGCSTSLSLNSPETDSVASIVPTVINPDVNYTNKRVALKAFAFVLSVDGERLMPCGLSKARKLLKAKRATIVKRYPFTIQLTFECENQVQEITFGVDSGYKNIGFSAVTEKKELTSGTVILDDKTSSRLTERRMYRRCRRNKLWYREPRFLNRGNKTKGWLPPSTQRRYDAHLKLLNLYKQILPITKVTVETANFDIQKINNSDIEGVDYQQGDMYGYQNVRSYLMARENGLCQLCHKKFDKGNPSHIHHLKERSNGGTNKPSNLAILHKKCHEKLHEKGLKLSAPKTIKAETFMSIIQNRFYRDIEKVKITFGYITFVNRINLQIEKTHYNDAFVICDGTNQERIAPIIIKQKHRNNRAIQLNRNGFAPSIRKQRYAIQPKDLIWIGSKKHVAVGVQNKGSYIKVENSKKVIALKNVEKIYNFGSFAYN